MDQLCLLSQGNLSFIQQLCDLMDEREYPANRDLPRTIDEIFAFRYANRKIQEYRDVCRAILEICLATRRPININILYNCLNIDEDVQLEWTIFLQVNVLPNIGCPLFIRSFRASRLCRLFSHNFPIPLTPSVILRFESGYSIILTIISLAISS